MYCICGWLMVSLGEIRFKVKLLAKPHLEQKKKMRTAQLYLSRIKLQSEDIKSQGIDQVH